MSVISPCWANACVQMILSVLKVLLCIFFSFLLAREHTDYEISLNVLKKKCVEVDCCEKWFDWKKVTYVDCFIFFFAFKTKIFVYTCSNRPNEVSIEFLWLYVITVDIYIFVKFVCYFCWPLAFLSGECVSAILFYCILKTQHLINMIVFFIIIQHIHNNNDSNHATNINFVL